LALKIPSFWYFLYHERCCQTRLSLNENGIRKYL